MQPGVGAGQQPVRTPITTAELHATLEAAGPEECGEWVRRRTTRNGVIAALAVVLLLLWATGRWSEPRGRAHMLHPPGRPANAPSFDTVYITESATAALLLPAAPATSTGPFRAVGNATALGAEPPLPLSPDPAPITVEGVATVVTLGSRAPPKAHTALTPAKGPWALSGTEHAQRTPIGRLVVRLPAASRGARVGWLPRPSWFPAGPSEAEYDRWGAQQAAAGVENAVVPVVLEAPLRQGWGTCGQGRWAGRGPGVVVGLTTTAARVLRCSVDSAAAAQAVNVSLPALLTFAGSGATVVPLAV